MKAEGAEELSATLSDMIRLPFSYFTPFQNYLWQKGGIDSDWLDYSEDQRIPAKGLFSESYPNDLSAPGFSFSENCGPMIIGKYKFWLY